jgi:hypothetical protein
MTDLVNALIYLQDSFSAAIAEEIWGVSMGRHLNNKWSSSVGKDLTPIGGDILFMFTSLDKQNKELLVKYLHRNVIIARQQDCEMA